MKLHLGCGKRYIPGFLHVDLDDFPHLDYRSSIERLPMFGDDSVELIYCCHAFAYFGRAQAIAVLREWRRVLEPGGILRLAVSDFSALVHLYRDTEDLNAILGPLFGQIVIQGPDGDTVVHMKTTYDYKSLQALCLQAGFRSLRPYDWRETIHKEYDDYSQAYPPHMDKEGGLLISLNVEAVK